MIKNNYILFLIFIFTYSCNNNEARSVEFEDSNPNWDIGVALYSFKNFTYKESIEMARESGVEIVEGFYFHTLGDSFGSRSLLELSDQEMSELKNILHDHGLRMPSIYAGADSKAEWRKFFELGKELGLDFLVGEPEPEYWDYLNELADEYSLKFAIHQHAEGRSRFWHPDSVQVALEGRSNFGVCGDLGHWVRSGIDPVEALMQLEDHLLCIHAKDLDEFGNIDANDVKIGNGVINFSAVLQELKRQDFIGKIYIEAEHDWDTNIESVVHAVHYLRSLEI